MYAGIPIPDALLQSLQTAPGFDAAAFCRVHETEPAAVSFRLNPFKQYAPVQLPQTYAVPWCSGGFYLAERPAFIFDPAFHAGAYYVQEASSMFIEQAVKQCLSGNEPLTALDLCAAPGGKSTHLLSLLPAGSVLVSNEVIKTRTPILVENMMKWGSAHSIVTQNDPADFSGLHEVFDLVLTDAPCSGSGLFRKDETVRENWNPQQVEHCAQRQKRILADIWPALKTGGLFLYATCSYSPEENEAVADWLASQFDAEPVALTVNEAWGVTVAETPNGHPAYRFWPNQVKGEGFFLACFVKRGAATVQANAPARKQRAAVFTSLTTPEKQQLPGWLQKAADCPMVKQEDRVWLMPERVAETVQQIKTALYIKNSGTVAGRVSHTGFIPEHGLALSVLAQHADAFAELDQRQALLFLKKENFDPGFNGKGWYLARFGKHNLGWFKHLGNRVNNYYPANLRILKPLPLV